MSVQELVSSAYFVTGMCGAQEWTEKRIRKELEQQIDQDLSDKKQFIRDKAPPLLLATACPSTDARVFCLYSERAVSCAAQLSTRQLSRLSVGSKCISLAVMQRAKATSLVNSKLLCSQS